MMNREKIALHITSAFCKGEFKISREDAPTVGWEGMPEVYTTNELRKNRATESEIRLFITFSAAMDRSRDADVLWRSSKNLFINDKSFFQPEIVSSYSYQNLLEILKQNKVSQRHNMDVTGWIRIALSLQKCPADDRIRNVIYKGQGDANQLLEAIRQNDIAGKFKYPFLRGPKVGPMWVRMLAYPGMADIRSLQIIPVSIDEDSTLETLKKTLFDMLDVIRIYSKPPGKPVDEGEPYTIPRGSTLMQFAEHVHKDFATKLRYARCWGSARFDGQTIPHEHILQDGDIIELHI